MTSPEQPVNLRIVELLADHTASADGVVVVSTADISPANLDDPPCAPDRGGSKTIIAHPLVADVSHIFPAGFFHVDRIKFHVG